MQRNGNRAEAKVQAISCALRHDPSAGALEETRQAA